MERIDPKVRAMAGSGTARSLAVRCTRECYRPKQNP
jgi:hypothetical protein